MGATRVGTRAVAIRRHTELLYECENWRRSRGRIRHNRDPYHEGNERVDTSWSIHRYQTSWRPSKWLHSSIKMTAPSLYWESRPHGCTDSLRDLNQVAR